MGEMSDVSDGYHTFGELYRHRGALFAALATSHPYYSWRSKKHHDGSMFDGETFIVGMELPNGIGQISYHYNLRLWSWFDGLRTLDLAPVYDGHSADDVIERLVEFAGWLNVKCVCRVGAQECPIHPGNTRTKEQKIAFRKAFDAEVERGQQKG